MPLLAHDDAPDRPDRLPSWVPDPDEPLPGDDQAPAPDPAADPGRDPATLTVPDWLLHAPHTADHPDLPATVPCTCACCQEPLTRPTDLGWAPASLAEEFERQWTLVQRHTARMWRAAAAMHAHVKNARGPHVAEHVGAELALITNTHPLTGHALMITSVRAASEVPQLAELVETGQLSDKHVTALLDEVGRWTDNPHAAREVVQLTLDRCRDRAARQGWPTPGQLKKRLRTAAIMRDLHAAETRRRSIAERRSAGLHQTGIGQAMLSIEGPDLMLAQMMDALRARAEALGRLPGDTRTLDQRLFDAAAELLLIDADGGDSHRPATGHDGAPLHLTVRGVHIAVLVPYSTTQGGNLELAEIPGYGPILPSTARELTEHATSLRRVAIDATTGNVLAVDDKTPGPAHPHHRPTTSNTSNASNASNDHVDDSGKDRDDRDDGGNARGDGADGDGDSGGGSADTTDDGHARDDGADGPDGPDGSQGSSPAPKPSGHDPTGHAGQPDHAPEPEPDPEPNPNPAPAPAPAPEPHPEPAAQSTTPSSAGTVPEHDPLSSQLSPTTVALLQQLAARRVTPSDLDSAHYTVPGRLRRHLELRDRTCTFPGCHVPGRHCDIDHREPWPHGPTNDKNCHCLCRRHHRAKQHYFTVTLDPNTGDTLWTTPDGRTYRRPPPRF